MLRDLPLKGVYRSDDDNLLEDFYIPALKASKNYDRAVGFFSANMISYAAQGLSALIANDGTMRLIVGGALDSEDADAIQQGYDRRQVLEKLERRLVRTVDEIGDILCYSRLEALSWMVACGSLTVKVALRRQGMYHEKIGILTDSEGDRIVFQGSANETASALLPDFNFESLNVFQSWKEELRGHYEPYIEGFERLWQNQSERTLVLDFPEAARERLVAVAKQAPPKPRVEVELQRARQLHETWELKKVSVEPQIPLTLGTREFRLRDYQREALNAWRSQSCRGVLKMATGTGKTLTCIYGAVKTYQSVSRMFLIVSVPYQALADQWVDELRSFSINPIPCYGRREDWMGPLEQFAQLYAARAKSFVAVVVVNKTFVSADFQDQLRRIPGDHMFFVGDECHHHRSPKAAEALPPQARLRMGLSATPEGYHDEEGSDNISRYYGPIVYQFDLDRAVNSGFLTPYDYHVRLVDLTDDEAERYESLSQKISQRMAIAGESTTKRNSDIQLAQLLFARARLLSAASNKLGALRELLQNERPQPFALFYCGDGTVEGEDDSNSARQIEVVSRILHEFHWRSSRFTAGESREERRGILDSFRTGAVDALVAIRCLDEGIDIPACRTAYLLASARNQRQFVQRRGRILRRHPGKDFAVIFDLIVKIPDHSCEEGNSDRQLFASELERIAEFARSSRNPADSYHTIEPLLKKFDLVHLFP